MNKRISPIINGRLRDDRDFTKSPVRIEPNQSPCQPQQQFPAPVGISVMSGKVTIRYINGKISDEWLVLHVVTKEKYLSANCMFGGVSDSGAKDGVCTRTEIGLYEVGDDDMETIISIPGEWHLAAISN